METAFLKSLEGRMSGKGEGEEEAKMSMTNTFTAEMGLLSSLGRDRVSRRVEQPGRTLPKLDVSKDPEVLRGYRKPRASTEAVVDTELKKTVTALRQRNGEVPVSSTGYAKLRSLEEKRKERHEEAVAAFHSAIVEFSDAAEDRVLRASRQVKDDVGDVDGKLSSSKQHLALPATLLGLDYDQLCHAWEDLKALCERWREVVAGFAAELDTVERERSAHIRHALQRLVSTLNDIAFVLPGEVERLAEKEALELNRVMLANREAHESVLATLRRAQVQAHVTARKHWLAQRERWRQLWHERALAQCCDALNSPTFTAPPERERVLADLRSSQLRLHKGRRLPLLQRLAASRPPDGLTSAAVDAIRRELEEVAEEEEAVTSRAFEALGDATQRAEEEARARVEALRRELHGYAALAPAPDLAAHQRRLRDAIGNDELAGLWRRAGALRAAVSTVTDTLGSPDIVYPRTVDALREALASPLSAFGVKAVLEAQGKGSDLSGLQEVCERMRSGTRAEMPALLPALASQVEAFAQIQGLRPRMRRELEDCGRDLEPLVEQAAAAAAPARESGSNARGSNARGSTARGSTVRGSTARGSTARGSTARGSKVSGSASSLGMDPALASLDMAAVRSVQGRVAMLAFAPELPDSVALELRAVDRSLRQQAQCNAKVDGAVAATTDALVARRAAEGRALVQAVGISLQEQGESLADGCDACVAFVAALARDWEAHQKREKEVDAEAEAAMDAELDAFEAEDRKLEARLEEGLRDLRHAPNLSRVEEAMASVVARLQAIEDHYRAYHSRACAAAAQHPVVGRHEVERYRRDGAARWLGLVPASEADIVIQRRNEVRSMAEEDRAARMARAREAAMGEVEPAPATAGKGKKGAGGKGGAAAEPEELPAPVREAMARAAAEVTMPPSLTGMNALQSRAGSEYRVRVAVGEVGARLAHGLAPTEAASEDARSSAAVASARVSTREADMRAAVGKAAAEVGPLSLFLGEDEEGEGGKEEKEEEEDKEDKEDKEEEEEDKEEEGGNSEETASAAAAAAVTALVRWGDGWTPLDGQGQPCVPPLSVGAAFGTELVRGLRDAVLDTLDENERTRNRELSGLEASRRTELTEELEERLRRHWPRTGRAEVQQRQPRETELTSHRLRYERYVRSVAARLRADRSEFDAALAAAKEAAAAHTREMQVLAASLPSQTSLAALQGVQTRAKALRTEYRQQCVSSLQGLLRLVRDAPQRLLAGTDEFLRSCILFDKGGDYDEEEVQAARAALADSDAAVRAEARERRGEAEGVRDLQQQALESYDAFEREFAESLQDLSMREGLGKKYGAPRRQAQEAVRSEMARSEREEAAIDAKLDALASLCDSTSTSGSTSTSTSVPALDADLARDLAPVEAEGDGTAAGEAAAEEEGAAGESDSDKPLVEALAAQAGLDVKAGGPHSVAGQVRLLLRLLRRALVYRAVYLDFLPDVTKAPLTRVDDGELPPSGQDWLQPAKAAEDAAAAPGAEGKGKEKGKGREKGKEKGKGKEKDQGGGAGGEEEAAAAEPLPRRQSLAEVANEAASACRDATRALYEAEGVAASLGEGGVPAALERFLDKQRRQVEEARVAYARRLREQVARLHSLLLHAPASALDDVMRRCAAAGDSAVSTALDSFSSRVAAWRKKRCAHEAALRPSLADPNRTAELAQLRSQELERSRSARSAAVATHREALRALQAAATSASVRTAHVASQLLVLVDSIVTEEQMGSLPGDEEKLHPRRGLKRLRKLRRRQAAKEGGEGGESDLVVGDDVRKPKRRWPGAPVSRLRLPDAALEAVYVEDAAERGQKRGGGDAEAGEGEKEEKEEEGKDKGKDEEEAKGGGEGDDAFSAFAAVPPDMHSPPLWSTVTSAARALMRHRDSALDAYSKDFEDAVSRVEDRTREFVREEATWADAWVVRTDALAEQQRQQSS